MSGTHDQVQHLLGVFGWRIISMTNLPAGCPEKLHPQVPKSIIKQKLLKDWKTQGSYRPGYGVIAINIWSALLLTPSFGISPWARYLIAKQMHPPAVHCVQMSTPPCNNGEVIAIMVVSSCSIGMQRQDEPVCWKQRAWIIEDQSALIWCFTSFLDVGLTLGNRTFLFLLFQTALWHPPVWKYNVRVLSLGKLLWAAVLI